MDLIYSEAQCFIYQEINKKTPSLYIVQWIKFYLSSVLLSGD